MSTPSDHADWFAPPPAEPAPGSDLLGEFWSIRQFSQETGRTRETVAKRIANNGVPAAFEENGNAKYRVKAVLPFLYSGADEGGIDPDKMEPHARKAHFEAEKAKRALAVSDGELIPRGDYEQEIARVFKTLNQGLDTVLDVLERDCGLSGATLKRLQQHLDPLRDALADQLSPRRPPPSLFA